MVYSIVPVFIFSIVPVFYRASLYNLIISKSIVPGLLCLRSIVPVFITGSFQDVCHVKHWPCCIRGEFAGERFSPAPPFPPCAGLSFPVGCAPPTAARALPAHLSAFGRQLFIARFASYGRGPSLRCVRLRRFCSLPPASALPNRAVLSHPLRGAYRAFEPGDNVSAPFSRHHSV